MPFQVKNPSEWMSFQNSFDWAIAQKQKWVKEPSQKFKPSNSCTLSDSNDWSKPFNR